jgi:hypothetical protein
MIALPRNLILAGDITVSGGNTGLKEVDIGDNPLLIYGGNVTVSDTNGTFPDALQRDVIRVTAFKYDTTDINSSAPEVHSLHTWLSSDRFRPFIVRKNKMYMQCDHVASTGTGGANNEFPITVTATLYAQRLTQDQADAYERAMNTGGQLAGLSDGVEKFGDMADVLKGLAAAMGEFNQLIRTAAQPQRQQLPRY